MKRNKSKNETKRKLIQDWFSYDDTTKTNQCLVVVENPVTLGENENTENLDEISICGVQITGTHLGNLERHLEQVHGDFYISDIKPRLDELLLHEPPGKVVKKFFQSTITRTITIQMSIVEVKHYVVEMLTLNGMPLSYVETSGFKNMMAPILKALGNFSINRKNVQTWIHEKASLMNANFSATVRCKMISLKIDAATRLEESYLGINAQYCLDGKIQVYTMGLVALDQRHTGEYLKDVIIKLLKTFGIDISQVLSITCDNGANVVKTVQLLNDEASQKALPIVIGVPTTDESTDSIIVNSSDADTSNANSSTRVEPSQKSDGDEIIFVEEEIMDDSDDDDNNNEDDDDTFTFDEELDNDAKNTENMIKEILNSFKSPEISTIRCCAHTLQLCGIDGLKKEINFICKIRKNVRVLRTEIARIYLKALGCKKKFKFNCKTRWLSTYDMVERIIENKRYVLELIKRKNLPITLTEADFTAMEEMKMSLAPMKSTIVAFQEQNLTFCEFYRLWKLCFLKTSKITSILARNLTNSMKTRESKLLEHEILISNIYLDPRYKNLLHDKPEQQKEATAFLIKLNRKLLHLASKEQEEKKKLLNSVNAKNIKSSKKKSVVQVGVKNMPSTSNSKQPVQTLVNSLSDDEAEEDEFDIFMSGINESVSLNVDNDEHDEAIDAKLLLKFEEFQTNAHLAPNDDIKQFWDENQKEYPEVYRLVVVIAAVPSTQVSVERLFSALKFIKNEYRNRLKEKILSNILIVRCNWYTTIGVGTHPKTIKMNFINVQKK